MATPANAAELKEVGNKHFQAGRYNEAVEAFSSAIELDPSNYILYSNRSAAYLNLKKFQNALEDATKVVELKPDFPKVSFLLYCS